MGCYTIEVADFEPDEDNTMVVDEIDDQARYIAYHLRDFCSVESEVTDEDHIGLRCSFYNISTTITINGIIRNVEQCWINGYSNGVIRFIFLLTWNQRYKCGYITYESPSDDLHFVGLECTTESDNYERIFTDKESAKLVTCFLRKINPNTQYSLSNLYKPT